MPDGNTEQVRAVAETVAKVAVAEYARQNPGPDAKIPTPLKWAGGIIGAVMTAATVGYFVWLTTTVSEMQITLTRLDERMILQSRDVERRLASLEHRDLGKVVP